ncbi:unnamed protein product [Dracunculus medinensis]|uniref:CUB domain-containing protein n=1 Tax=Dracunculus medinensis TaxID=318479 RepID=A0A0N4UCC1_DRAME|nr:unnamed protein product [Dracunculus medinensis]
MLRKSNVIYEYIFYGHLCTNKRQTFYEKTSLFDKKTIVTRDELYQNTIGQRSQLSFKDAKMINLRYCTNKCYQEMVCYHGGYTDPNYCSRCICPSGWGGTNCQDVEPSRTAGCGKTLIAANESVTITSPTLVPNVHCVWRIKSIAQVDVTIGNIILPCQESCGSFVELKYHNDMTRTGPRLCCSASKRRFISDGNDFIIIYSGSSNADSRFSGFQFSYKTYDESLHTTKTWTNAKTTSAISLTTKQSTGPINTRGPLTPSRFTHPTTPTVGKESLKQNLGSHWSAWGQWSECSVTCGGCGVRKRVRACYGGNRTCSGPDYATEKCGEKRCEQASRIMDCKGRIVLPCDLMNKLDFGIFKTIQSDSKMERNEAILNVSTIELLNRRGRSIGTICEKRFSYFCVTNLLTLAIDWKRAHDVVRDSNGCCKGYFAVNGNCVKI